MRSPDDRSHLVLAKGLISLLLCAGLGACAQNAIQGVPAASVGGTVINGPRADYPVLVGEPYSINGVEYVPVDTLNFDQVGYLALDAEAAGYTGSHHTLPIPSYVEVTSLETGRTILVRLERRGPMNSNELLGLSPQAIQQLGASIETPVRVRRVTPPEEQRFLLRAGEAAPLRMDTPTSLLTVLRRRVPQTGATSLRGAEPPAEIETVELAASSAADEAMPVIAGEPVDLAPQTAQLQSSGNPARAATTEQDAPIAQSADGAFLVQAAAFSTRERAERAATALGGAVSEAGPYFRVRTGPFATRGEAEASLANVRRAGYSDARILTSG